MVLVWYDVEARIFDIYTVYTYIHCISINDIYIIYMYEIFETYSWKLQLHQRICQKCLHLKCFRSCDHVRAPGCPDDSLPPGLPGRHRAEIFPSAVSLDLRECRYLSILSLISIYIWVGVDEESSTSETTEHIGERDRQVYYADR